MYAQFEKGTLLLKNGNIENGLIKVRTSGGIKYKKISAQRSIKGMIILHEDGLPIADLLTEELSRKDPTLVSGAVIKNCLGNVDYEHVKERLVHHLSNEVGKQPD